MEVKEKQRIIQEFVPGKQITLAHVIAGPDPAIYVKLGLEPAQMDAIGILTITPSEGAVSYTHLDVYKRQGSRSGGGSSFFKAVPDGAAAHFGDQRGYKIFLFPEAGADNCVCFHGDLRADGGEGVCLSCQKQRAGYAFRCKTKRDESGTGISDSH